MITTSKKIHQNCIVTIPALFLSATGRNILNRRNPDLIFQKIKHRILSFEAFRRFHQKAGSVCG